MYTPVMVLCICWSVSPSPSMMDVLVSTEGFTSLACLRTLRDWSMFALGSRTNLQTDGQMDILFEIYNQKGKLIYP